MSHSVPANDLVASLSQTLLHELAVQTTAPHRLTRSRSCSPPRTNGSSTCGNIFQIWFVTVEQ